MFGDADGASFLTESIRSTTSTGESPKVTRPAAGDGLFNDKEEDEIFSSSSSK